MEFLKNKANKTQKRKRNDSTSSNTSSNHSEKKSYEAIPKFECYSDNSTSSGGIALNLESSNSSLKAPKLSYIPKRRNPYETHTKILKFLSKSGVAHKSDKNLQPQLDELWEIYQRNRSSSYGDNFSAVQRVPSPRGFRKFYSQYALTWSSSSSSDDDGDDDNVPSTSSGHGKKRQSKVSSKENSTSLSPTSKLKRRASASSNALSDKDTDFGYEPPSAKRQQRVPSIYQSQPGSVASSVYPSPLNELLVQDIDTESNTSNINSTDTEYDDANDGASENAKIPDSPNSLENSDDSDDSKCLNHSCDGNCANTSYEDDIISQISSPYPAQFRRTTPHNGERTPAHCLLQDSNSTTELKKPKVTSLDEYVANSVYNCMTPAAENDPLRLCPLPALSWANAHDVWQTMCKKDEETTCLRDSGMLERHPGLQPRMRAILLDWLIEVCEVYKLHRETYYLAVDYLDRYLTTKLRVQKTHLQLIGITCLFVAAKVEEIYPPKIGEFAYVTDGACQEADILHNEILLLQALDWDINPVTPMGWLGIYMQLNVNNRTPKTFAKENKPKPDQKSESSVDEAFIYPQFSGFEFVQTAQLLDLCSLDVGVAHFSYSVLAAAAMSHTFNRETALRCSGLDWQTIQPCARWMKPFFVVISSESEHLYIPEQNEQVPSKFGLGHICSNISTDDSHIIQTHSITMGMFDRVTQIQEQLISLAKPIKPEASPAIGLICPDGLLTPPASSRKPLDVLDEDHTKTTTKSTNTTTASATTKNMQDNNAILTNKSVSTVEVTGIVEAKSTTVGTSNKKT